jgi:hypothetical protein
MKSLLPFQNVSRESIPSPLVGKLVRINGHETYEDIIGIYVGSFRTPKWDQGGVYTFHSILGSDGVVHNYCMQTREKPEKIMQVLA